MKENIMKENIMTIVCQSLAAKILAKRLLATTLFGMLGVAGTLGAAQAQVPGTYTTSWLGDTYGKGGQPTDAGQYWMQDYIAQMTVQPDGTCYTKGPWDEGGRTNGIYKDGQVIGNQDYSINDQSVSVGGHTWSISNGGVTGDDGRYVPNAVSRAALGVSSDGLLLVADNGPREQVLFYDVSGVPQQIDTFGAPGGIGASYTSGYDLPAATNAPGYPAGTYGPGVYHPFKLWNLTGVGEDSSGRLFVSRSSTGGGSAILCFKRDGGNNWILDWRIESYCFVDSVDFDSTTDGQDVYGVQEHYKLNYGSTDPGSEWSLFAFTADNQAFPNDPRNIDDVHSGQEHGLTSSWYRTVSGHRLLFTEGLTAQMLNIFRFEDNSERAIPAGLIMAADHTIYMPSNGNGLFWPPNRPSPSSSTLTWRDASGDGDYQAEEYGTSSYPYSYGLWPDNEGNIWQAGNPLICRQISWFDVNGNPDYDDADVHSYGLSGIGSVGRVQYQEDADRMVLCDKGYNDLTGGSIFIINNWSSGNRSATQLFGLSSDHPIAICAAGDYLFEAGYNSRGKVWVHSLLDGSLVGTMDVPDSLGGNGYSGNVDITYGLHAFKRANGEYEVTLEDDGWAKVLLYRWNPNGGGTAPIGQTVGLKANSTGYYVTSYQNDSGKLRADQATGIQDWEKYSIEDAGNGFVALKANATGFYVTAYLNDGGKLRADQATTVQDWEKFQWVDAGGGFSALKSNATGFYVTAYQDTGELRADQATTIQDWEKFSRP